jgi:hypothetical protein
MLPFVLSLPALSLSKGRRAGSTSQLRGQPRKMFSAARSHSALGSALAQLADHFGDPSLPSLGRLGLLD